MRNDKQKATELRRQGLSYKTIHRQLGTPLGTLAGWFKNEPWSGEIKTRLSAEVSLANPQSLKLMALANKERWKSKRAEYRAAAIQEFEAYKNDPLFLAGVMLYWGQGDKTSSAVVRINSDSPEMIRTFYSFLTKALKISSDKTWASLVLYPGLIDSVQKNFWAKTAGIPTENFKKAVLLKGGQSNNRHSSGVCTIGVSSRALKDRILEWIELYQDFLRAHARTLEKRD